MADFLKRAGLQPYMCPACGRAVALRGRCSQCGLSYRDAQTATQLIRVYDSGNLERAFQRDAKQLSKFGWVAGQPAYGGLQYPSLLSGNRKAKTLTVVYTRPAPAPAAAPEADAGAS